MIHYIENDNKMWCFPSDETSQSSILNNFDTKGIKYMIVNEPFDDFIFFNAYTVDWSLPSGSISGLIEDIEAGKEVFKKLLREKRDPLFPDLDIQFMRAIEKGDSVLAAEIGAKKQELRDITLMDLSSVTDLASLKALWPTVLLGDSPF